MKCKKVLFLSFIAFFYPPNGCQTGVKIALNPIFIIHSYSLYIHFEREVICINRKQRRSIAKKTGMDFDTVSLIDLAMQAVDKYEKTPRLIEGETVLLDTKSIFKRKKGKSEKYLDFVRENADKEFTVMREEKYKGKPIVSLVEDPNRPRFLFFEGDLISPRELREAVETLDYPRSLNSGEN